MRKKIFRVFLLMLAIFIVYAMKNVSYASYRYIVENDYWGDTSYGIKASYRDTSSEDLISDLTSSKLNVTVDNTTIAYGHGSDDRLIININPVSGKSMYASDIINLEFCIINQDYENFAIIDSDSVTVKDITIGGNKEGRWHARFKISLAMKKKGNLVFFIALDKSKKESDGTRYGPMVQININNVKTVR